MLLLLHCSPQTRWEKFTAAISSQQHKGVAASVGELFPFKEFFADAPQPLFKGQSYEEVG
jgi:intron-binding protein aquarius